jgi:hypothetical protein
VIASTDSSGPSNPNEGYGLSGGAIAGIILGILGVLILLFFIVKFALRKREKTNESLGSSASWNLIGKVKIRMPFGKQVTGSPRLLGEAAEMGERAKTPTQNLGIGGRIYWNNYI